MLLHLGNLKEMVDHTGWLSIKERLLTNNIRKPHRICSLLFLKKVTAEPCLLNQMCLSELVGQCEIADFNLQFDWNRWIVDQ